MDSPTPDVGALVTAAAARHNVSLSPPEIAALADAWTPGLTGLGSTVRAEVIDGKIATIAARGSHGGAPTPTPTPAAAPTVDPATGRPLTMDEQIMQAWKGRQTQAAQGPAWMRPWKPTNRG
jgi:hypothetical protein